MTLLLDYLNKPNLFNKFRKKVSDFFLAKTINLHFLRVFLLRTVCGHVFRSRHWSVITRYFCNDTRFLCNSVMLFCMSKKVFIYISLVQQVTKFLWQYIVFSSSKTFSCYNKWQFPNFFYLEGTEKRFASNPNFFSATV